MHEPANDNNQQTDQKHKHGNLIDAMHHAEIEVGTVIGIFFAKPVHDNRTQIKPVF